jgi:hypothetical protein
MVIAADTDERARWLAGPSKRKFLGRRRGDRILLLGDDLVGPATVGVVVPLDREHELVGAAVIEQRPLINLPARHLLEGPELARWRLSAVGRGAIGTPRFEVVLLRDRGQISAPFPAPARQSVHAVLPHTAIGA